jgi:hypothetical protein
MRSISACFTFGWGSTGDCRRMDRWTDELDRSRQKIDRAADAVGVVDASASAQPRELICLHPRRCTLRPPAPSSRVPSRRWTPAWPFRWRSAGYRRARPSADVAAGPPLRSWSANRRRPSRRCVTSRGPRLLSPLR